MRMYLRELDYDNTLIMLAKFMEIREQKPFFSTDSLLLWLKSSLEDGEKLNIKSTAEDAADGVTVNVNIQIIKGMKRFMRQKGQARVLLILYGRMLVMTVGTMPIKTPMQMH